MHLSAVSFATLVHQYTSLHFIELLKTKNLRFKRGDDEYNCMIDNQ